ncbi:hypothetical protein FBUS_05547 [Fasciolopsis buskii]|uniref:Uncharacterized protein n=1 Tax=Fasciolopsis buskii TaxID=27845 RepID=A0A8E0RYG7_9TREM|nr:hypothetical protein FBUS_05547 [Fasciolopsis buski]
MIPGASRPDVTAEALNMLEAYLHFESLNEFESNNGDTATCTDACVAQVDGRNPFGSFQSSAAGFDPSTNSLRRKFAWLDPLNRVEYTLPSLPRSNEQPNHRCSLCGKNVSDQRRKSRSALSAQCSPERRIPLETRNSLPFGCEGLLQSGKVAMSNQGGKGPFFSLAHTEEVSDLEGLSSPCPPALIEFSASDSQPQSVCDKIDGIDSFQRQQSSFSASASIGLSSLPTSGLPSRTSSQAKVQIQIQNTLSPSGDSHPGGLALRSRSAGSSNLTQKCHVIHPSVHWTSPSDATDQAISYVRCESVHSAPGDARHRIDLEKTGRDSSRKWFRFSLPKSRRKLSRPFNLPRNSGSFSVNHSTTWNSTNNEDPPVIVQKQSRHSGAHLGLDSLLHLIPRWFRGHDTSPDTYVSTGFPVRLRRSVFRNASRRKRHKVYEQTGEKNNSIKERFLRVPNLSPIYIPDRLSDPSGRPMTENSMASNDGSALPASVAVGPHKPAPSDNNGTSTTPVRLVTSPSMLSEVSRLYEEILHTAEGGRLGESTVQVWRSFTDRAGQVDNVSMHFIDVDNLTRTQSNFC